MAVIMQVPGMHSECLLHSNKPSAAGSHHISVDIALGDDGGVARLTADQRNDARERFAEQLLLLSDLV